MEGLKKISYEVPSALLKGKEFSMKGVFLGLLAFIMAGILLLPQVTSWQLPIEYYLFGPIAIMLLAMLIQLDAIFIFKKLNQLQGLAGENQKLATEIKTLTEKLHEEKKQTTELKTQLIDIEKQHRDQQRELQDAKKATSQLKQILSDMETAFSEAKQQIKSANQQMEQMKLQKNTEGSVVSFLSLLQEKGRFIDYVMEDISQFTDQQVGAASRVVHQGCQKVLKDFFAIKPLRNEDEGSDIAIKDSENPRTYRLLGQVKGEAPFKGKIVHRGWLTEKVALPKLQDSVQGDAMLTRIIAPCEVELY